MGDWLGTGYIAPSKREFRPFEEAREFAHSLGLKSSSEWERYCQSGKRPNDIPSNPSQVYREEWKGEPDWLVYEAETIWLPNRVKELLKGLIESRAIYEWDEAVLYSFLLRKGLLNLDNRHKQFFRNLIEASRTNDGKEANSDSETPP